MVQTQLLSKTRKGPICILALFDFFLAPGRILHEEGQHRICFRNGVNAIDDKFCILNGTTPDIRRRYRSLDVHNTFGGQCFQVFDHFGGLLGVFFILEEARLERIERVLP